MLILIIICVFETNKYSKNKFISNQKIDDNEIFLFHELSTTYKTQLFNMVFPIVSTNLMYETNPYKQIKNFKKLEDYLKSNQSIIFNMNINDTDIFEVYPFEFYSVSEKRSYYTIDRFIEKNGFDNNINIDTSDLFSLPKKYSNDDSEFSIKISKEQFIECSNELKEEIVSGKNLEIVCSILLLKEGKSFIDFYSSETYMELESNDCNLIQNNDLVEIINEIKNFDNILIMLKNIVFSGLLLLVIDLLFLFILLLLNKKKIFIIRDYNYDFEESIEIIRKKINNRYIKLIIIIMFIVLNTKLTSRLDFSIINYLPSISIILITSLDFKISNILIKKFIKNKFNWRSR